MNNHASVVIVSWCSTEHVFNLLKQTIESVFKSNSDYYNLTYDIIIVDNASPFPAVKDYLKQLESAGVKVIYNTENHGYSKAANQGLSLAINYSSWVMLLNSDALMTPGLLHYMVDTAESDDKIAVVGCKVLKPGTDIVIHSGTTVNEAKTSDEIDNPWCGVKLKHTTRFLNPDRLWVNGCCIMFKTSILKSQGLFDESYRFYFEEAAYCTNLIKKGYRVVCCDAGYVYHHEKQSALQNEVETKPQFYKSWERYWKEHAGLLSVVKIPVDPTVHVVVPCYNSEKYLERTLNSLFNQTYRNFKLWLVDDCSTDGTLEIAKKFEARILKTEVNSGVSAARNAAINEILKVSGDNDIIKYLDSDDVLRNDALEKMIWQFKQNKNLQFFCSDVNCQFEDGKNAVPYGITSVPIFDLETLLKSNYIYTSTVAHKADMLKKHNIRFEKGIESIEDWAFWSALAFELRDKKDACLLYPEKLVIYIVKYSNNVAAQSNQEKYNIVISKNLEKLQLIKGNSNV